VWVQGEGGRAFPGSGAMVDTQNQDLLDQASRSAPSALSSLSPADLNKKRLMSARILRLTSSHPSVQYYPYPRPGFRTIGPAEPVVPRARVSQARVSQGHPKIKLRQLRTFQPKTESLLSLFPRTIFSVRHPRKKRLVTPTSTSHTLPLYIPQRIQSN